MWTILRYLFCSFIFYFAIIDFVRSIDWNLQFTLDYFSGFIFLMTTIYIIFTKWIIMIFSHCSHLPVFTGKRDASQAEMEAEEDDEVSQFLLIFVSLTFFVYISVLLPDICVRCCDLYFPSFYTHTFINENPTSGTHFTAFLPSYKMAVTI